MIIEEEKRMQKIELLDCTLRDGGYVNDWKFSKKNIISIFERLVNAGVDIIEVGFLDERRPFDEERSIMPNTKCIDDLFKGIDKKNSMVVGMIDYGTCSIENISSCEDSFLDGIRVIFKKHLMYQALEFCKQVKALGYNVFAQLVSITAYDDDDLLELIDLANEVKPYAVSMVDTYGLMHPEDMMRYYNLLDAKLEENIKIGFHAHNNFQLAYANVLSFIEKDANHDLIVDGTLHGMGKSAGNAPIELIGMRLNEKYGKSYKIDSMLEGIEESVMDFYKESPWGYKTFFYLCGKNKCHPNYLTYFQGKHNLSTSKIDKLLGKIEPNDKKLMYDKEIAENLYLSYLNNNGNDNDSMELFANEISNRELLIIGPGKNIQLQSKVISDFIKDKNPYIVSINYIPNDMDVDCVFVTNKKRYHEMIFDLKKNRVKVLATTNVECRDGEFDYVINRAPLLEADEKIIDNSFLMLIKVMKRIGIKAINCAGFDGYSDKEDNYCNPDMEYSFVKKEARNLNYHMKKRIAEFRKSIDIKFITYSAYDIEEDINGAAI